MSVKSERKKAIKAQKQAEATGLEEVVPIKFKGFDFTHEEDCKCNLDTIDTIEEVLLQFGFVEAPCSFAKKSGAESHQVYVPEGLEKIQKLEDTCPSCWIKVLTAYANFAGALSEAGLDKNFHEACECIREFVRNGKFGKCYFHPSFEEEAFAFLDSSAPATPSWEGK